MYSEKENCDRYTKSAKKHTDQMSHKREGKEMSKSVKWKQQKPIKR